MMGAQRLNLNRAARYLNLSREVKTGEWEWERQDDPNRE
jgi:hypothetical protein